MDKFNTHFSTNEVPQILSKKKKKEREIIHSFASFMVCFMSYNSESIYHVMLKCELPSRCQGNLLLEDEIDRVMPRTCFFMMSQY